MHRTHFFRNLTLSSLIGMLALAGLDCGRKPGAKHYPLHGRVMSIDKLGHELIIDHDSIPGFMEAMTMPYPVSDNSMMEQVVPGDEIRADLKVEGERISIDKIEVIKKAMPAGTLVPKPMHVPQTGEQVPNFALINQSGQPIRFSEYRGKTL